MPKINQLTFIEITPERFINCCNDTELMELWILLNSSIMQRRLKDIKEGKTHTPVVKLPKSQ